MIQLFLRQTIIFINVYTVADTTKKIVNVVLIQVGFLKKKVKL